MIIKDTIAVQLQPPKFKISRIYLYLEAILTILKLDIHRFVRCNHLSPENHKGRKKQSSEFPMSPSLVSSKDGMKTRCYSPPLYNRKFLKKHKFSDPNMLRGQFVLLLLCRKALVCELEDFLHKSIKQTDLSTQNIFHKSYSFQKWKSFT